MGSVLYLGGDSFDPIGLAAMRVVEGLVPRKGPGTHGDPGQVYKGGMQTVTKEVTRQSLPLAPARRANR
jgi:hypothetical protein